MNDPSGTMFTWWRTIALPWNSSGRHLLSEERMTKTVGVLESSTIFKKFLETTNGLGKILKLQRGSEYWPFECQTFWSLDYKLLVYVLCPMCYTDHLNTGPVRKQDGVHLSSIQFSECRVFKWHLITGPFGIQPIFDRSSLVFRSYCNFYPTRNKVGLVLAEASHFIIRY